MLALVSQYSERIKMAIWNTTAPIEPETSLLSKYLSDLVKGKTLSIEVSANKISMIEIPDYNQVQMDNLIADLQTRFPGAF